MKTFALLLLFPLATDLQDAPTAVQDPAASPHVSASAAQVDSLATEFRALERRVNRISSEIEDKASTGFILFLYGVFCALWAQNTGRGPWLWFFLGALFNVVTVVFLLMKNADDLREVAREA